jgi:hypothetical protein
MAEPVLTRETLIADLDKVRTYHVVRRATRSCLVACSNCSADTREGCPICLGVGAVEGREIDWASLEEDEDAGCVVEGFDLKGGRLVPKFRSKDKAAALQARLAGYDTQKVELSGPGGGSFAVDMSPEELAEKTAQLKELFELGVFDKPATAPAG